MNVYVAGRTKDIENVNAVQQIVRDAGHKITFDWTGAEGEIRSNWTSASDRAREIAHTERDAVAASDLVILVWKPVGLGDSGPVGALIETGMALAGGKYVIVYGPARESVFWYTERVSRANSRDKLIIEIGHINAELTEQHDNA